MKKLAAALTLALLATSVAGAADITLNDGRMLREAVVIKQDAATVTFRHSAGFTQIEKSKLPESLATEFPLDADQAKLEAEQQRQEVLARRAEAERLFALRVQLAAAAPKPAEVPAVVEPQPSADSPTWGNSWVDTYNAESWRLMRHRDRQYRRDRDRQHDQGRDRHSGYENRRGEECPPTASRPSPRTQLTHNVTMTPDVHMTGFDPSPVSTQPAETELPPQPRRSRF